MSLASSMEARIVSVHLQKMLASQGYFDRCPGGPFMKPAKR